MTSDDEPTETLTDNVSEVEWTEDDEAWVGPTAPLSEAEQLMAVLHRLTGAGHVVEFHGTPRQVIVTRRGELGDTLSVHEHARGRTYIEALHVAAARLDGAEFDCLRVRRKCEHRYWPVLITGRRGVAVAMQEFAPVKSVHGWEFGPGLDDYREACEWLAARLTQYEAAIHDDDWATHDELQSRTSSVVRARDAVRAMRETYERILANEDEWQKLGGF